MDQYGRVRPDAPDFEDDVADIAAILAEGRSVEVSHAYRMTLTKLVITPQAAIAWSGRPVVTTSGELFVGVIGKGAEWLTPGGLHWTDVREWLGVANEVDATAIASFLDRVGAATRAMRDPEAVPA